MFFECFSILECIFLNPENQSKNILLQVAVLAMDSQVYFFLRILSGSEIYIFRHEIFTGLTWNQCPFSTGRRKLG